ncbi:MAG: hypothetical protein GXP05_12325 [Alphaproteobacteria bacterium]|nr:hypothetical protein [Alphaproteobacteria bacterium]
MEKPWLLLVGVTKITEFGVPKLSPKLYIKNKTRTHIVEDLIWREKLLLLGLLPRGLIEDAPVDLILGIFEARGKENDNEPEFGLVEILENEPDGDPRDRILENLSRYDKDDLIPVEQRCWRVRNLAEGKGVASLEMVVKKRLSNDDMIEYDKQPDSLCRSIWTFLNRRRVFDDAESFHFARKFRDLGKMYDAFEVELEKASSFDAASVDGAALAARITEVLELKTKCMVTAMDLSATDAHPASVMLIVRHGGPLSSVHDHRDDGRRGTIYFRPPNEATLIYTPVKKQIEICADSPAVRQQVSGVFAEVALNHDISQKPLTWKRYDLGRFRSSLTLPVPSIDGFEIHLAKVLEVEVRLGSWKRKLGLKVSIDDDIDAIAKKYLGPNSIIKRAECSRVSASRSNTTKRVMEKYTPLTSPYPEPKAVICRAKRIRMNAAWALPF